MEKLSLHRTIFGKCELLERKAPCNQRKRACAQLKALKKVRGKLRLFEQLGLRKFEERCRRLSVRDRALVTGYRFDPDTWLDLELIIFEKCQYYRQFV